MSAVPGAHGSGYSGATGNRRVRLASSCRRKTNRGQRPGAGQRRQGGGETMLRPDDPHAGLNLTVHLDASNESNPFTVEVFEPFLANELTIHRQDLNVGGWHDAKQSIDQCNALCGV